MNNFIASFESAFDENPEFSVMDFLKTNAPNINDLQRVKKIYSDCYHESISCDPQVIEAYGDKLEYWQYVYENIVQDIELYIHIFGGESS